MDGKTAVDQLVAQRNGEIVNIDGADKGQCTAIPHAFEVMLGLPLVYGNAIDTYNNAPVSLYNKELNTPTNFPKPGAIWVGEPNNPVLGTGPYGHTGVVVSADVNTFTSLEQNDAGAVAAHLVTRNYEGIKGWFRPKKLTDPAPVPQPKTVTVTAHPFLWLRTGPGTSFPHATGTDGNGNPIQSVPPGAVVQYVEVVQGEPVIGNSTWLKSVHGNYFWAGGTNYRPAGRLASFLGVLKV